MFESIVELTGFIASIGLILALIALAALVHTERQRARVDARLRRVTGERTARSRRLTGQTGSLAHLRDQLRQIVVRMGERLSVILGGEARDTAADLRSAGYRSRDALLIYAFAKTVLPVAAFGIGSLWVLTTRDFGAGMILPAAAVLATALALSKAVDFVIDTKRKTRLARIRRGFPDLLELLVITSEAGLGPQQALHRVARELQVSSPELAGEILQMVSEVSMTNDKRTAYDKLTARVPLPEVGVFTQTLDQSDKYGTPFARAMRSLIVEQRANRLIFIEEKAARLPVIMTLPLIFCIMPAVFVVLVGPAALSIIDNILSGG
ncbi:type II secretion system F family protein [Rhodobacterales bacterium HKCCE4037]|nr:type II secretion system F family protein [Rhodobacterales bacterium HKCCE4037]